MWTRLSQDDLRGARDSLTLRQIEMDARHLEELKALEARHADERNALDAKLGQMGELERMVGAFVEEYLETAPADLPPEPPGEPEAKVQATPADPPAPRPVEVDATSWYRRRFRSA
jgi:hypothetical protein